MSVGRCLSVVPIALVRYFPNYLNAVAKHLDAHLITRPNRMGFFAVNRTS